MAYSQRLETIAGLCKGPAIVDVGYDHGLLLSLLWDLHPDWRLVGVEVDEGFAARAQVPPQVELRVGDGLSACGQLEATCAVFAGLGEERIRDLLERDWAVAEKLQRIVVCASSIDGKLRPWMAARGWRCAEEQLLREGKRLYLVTALEAGVESERDHLRLSMGPRLFDGPDLLLDAWQAFWERRFSGRR